MSRTILKKESSDSFFKKRNASLILSVIVSSALLILINFHTIKTTSAVRAYINGESRYSKGQKDGARHLITYLSLGEDKYFQMFNDEIKVPLGDSLARVGLLNNGSYVEVRAGFLQGKNHEEDIDDMIWLFRNFKNVSFMKEAITIWKEADVLIGRLKTIGDDIKNKEDVHAIATKEKEKLITAINDLTTKLTVKERAFSDLLGATARKINAYLFAANFFIILFIITCVVAYSYKGIKELMKTKSDLEQTNKDLIEINQELDNFIYAASHDLKSPINNMEGLVELLKVEGNRDQQEDLLEKMDYSIASLRKTIAGLTEVIKIDKNPLEDVEEHSFENVMLEFSHDNVRLLEETGTKIFTSFEAEKIVYSSMGIKSIFQNLLTNAIKYRSQERNCVIEVKTFMRDQAIVLEVHDNGLGMDLVRNGHKLFKMFTRLHDHVEGTGLGLYMIKRIIEKRGGDISVESSPGVGTKFLIRLT
jgi:signal transduction histidine kinase